MQGSKLAGAHLSDVPAQLIVVLNMQLVIHVPVPAVPGSSSETVQQSRLFSSKSRLLMTFNCKVVAIKKFWWLSDIFTN